MRAIKCGCQTRRKKLEAKLHRGENEIRPRSSGRRPLHSPGPTAGLGNIHGGGEGALLDGEAELIRHLARGPSTSSKGETPPRGRWWCRGGGLGVGMVQQGGKYNIKGNPSMKGLTPSLQYTNLSDRVLKERDYHHTPHSGKRHKI